MSQPELPEWERLIQLAETEPDLEKATAYVEEAESALFFRLNELVHSSDGHLESEVLDRATDRLLRIKSEKLNWPNPFTNGAG
jgi:hypothetical protein